MLLALVILFFVFITGLVIGSFLNVVILRTISGESIVFPPSKCPKCENPLKWFHNIPVVSYLFLRGKCAFCNEKISIQYPLVEMMTGIIFVLLFFKFCNPIDPIYETLAPITLLQVCRYILALVATCIFIVLSGTDFIEKQVANVHVYSLIGIGVFYSLAYSLLDIVLYSKMYGLPAVDVKFFFNCPFIVSVLCALIGFIAMEVLSFAGVLLVKTRGFGQGDSYILAGIGSIFGALYAGEGMLYVLEILGLALLLSVFIQVIFTFPVFVKKLLSNKDWLTIGALSTFIIYAITYVFAQNFGWLSNIFAYAISTIVLVTFGILTCKELLNGVRTHQSSGMYLPFGPAMLTAAFILMLSLPI